jgi:protein phosphatase
VIAAWKKSGVSDSLVFRLLPNFLGKSAFASIEFMLLGFAGKALLDFWDRPEESQKIKESGDCMDAFGLTDRGKARDHNEDAIFSSAAPVGVLPSLFIVSDGMGGHNAGEVASAKAIEFFLEAANAGLPIQSAHEFMKGAALGTNNKVYELSKKDEKLDGMGATFTAVSVSGLRVSVCHIGDSRLYVATEKGLRLMTEDHSYVQQLVKARAITQSQADRHPDKHLLTRVLGAVPDEEIDSFEFEAEEGSILLLCSDGLSNMLEEREIFELAMRPGTLFERASGLIEAANRHGGLDNISAVLVDLKG